MTLDINTINKSRTEGTVQAIMSNIKNVTSENLISDLFIEPKDDITFKLIKRFEAILIKASMHSKYLEKNLHNFYIETDEFLRENNLYKEFIEFSYFIYSNLGSKNINYDVFLAYNNLLYQQFTYITPGNMLCGISTSNELIVRDEIFPKLDYAIHKLKRNKKISFRDAYKEYGYDINSPKELEKYIYNETLLTNMTFVMSNFINEDTLDILPKSYYMPSYGITILREWKNTDFYRQLLKKRRYVLPQEGVIGKYHNAGDIFSILFKEVFIDDRIYLLYQICDLFGNGFYGAYDTKSDFFYSVYKDTTGEAVYHKFIENFVLENYCHLTTDMEIDRKRNMGLKVVDNIDAIDFNYPNQPVVQFVYNEKTEFGEKKIGKKNRVFDKKKYKEETIQISPYIRKLPEGMEASDEAKKRARELGYELREGETFVRSFERKNFVLKDK